MAANQIALGQKIAEYLKPVFTDLGLALDTFVVENLSLPDELQKLLDQRIGMNMVGDMGRYTQFQVAQSMPIAAANEGGGAAGIGVGLGAGITMAQQMMNAMKPGGAPAAPARRSAWEAPGRRRRRPSSASIAASRSRARRSSAPSAAARSNKPHVTAASGWWKRTGATRVAGGSRDKLRALFAGLGRRH